MAEFTGIVFNGVQNPNFMKVKSISHNALPPISSNTLIVPGRAGSIDLKRNVIGDRRIDIEIFIISADKNMLPKQLELLAKWLYHEEAKELVLGDNPNRKYYAKLDGTTDFSEILRVGQGTISFICTDPFIYGNERSVTLPDLSTQEIVSVMNNGNMSTPPVITLNVVEQSSIFGVVANNEFVEIGQAIPIDSEQPGYDPRVLYDPCRSLNGWVQSSGVYGGTVVNQELQVGTDNERFEPKGGLVEETEQQKWYGPVYQKQLTKETQNFTAQVNFRIQRSKSSEKNGSGKMTYVFRDNNNADISTVRFYDNRNGENCLLVEWGMIQPGVKTTWVFTDIPAPSNVNDWYGHFVLRRDGNKWSLKVFRDYQDNSTLVAHGTYVDSTGTFNRKLKYFQVGFLRWEKDPVNYMAFSHVDIQSLDRVEQENKPVDFVVYPGDKITINNVTGKVYRNDALLLKGLNPSSTFIKLESGLNNIGFYPRGIFNGGTIAFKERY